MKVAYKGEPVPKSILPLIGLVLASWVSLTLLIIVLLPLTGG